MESTGVKDCIHLSNETAQLLIEAGKEDWLVERGDKVIAKGMISRYAFMWSHTPWPTRQRRA